MLNFCDWPAEFTNVCFLMPFAGASTYELLWRTKCFFVNNGPRAQSASYALAHPPTCVLAPATHDTTAGSHGL